MASGPGVSLFQSTEVLQLNTSAQREEEEEALEDEKRRNEELQDLLTNAFDDMSDNDDEGQSTLNSSHCDASCNGLDEMMSYNRQMPLQQLAQGMTKPADNVCNLLGNKENWQQNSKIDIVKGKFSPTYQQHYYNTDLLSKLDVQDAYRQADYNSVDQLQVLYEVRIREIKRLTEQVEAEQRDAAQYKDQMFRKLALCEAEKERAILSRTQANELLVKSKGEIGELQKEVTTLKHSVESLEKTKSELSKEVGISHTMINELQQKLTMMERCDVQKNLAKEMDSVVKELKNKHQEELSRMQHHIDFITAKCNQKENECSLMEQKVVEMQRAQEALLVEKSDTINQLARSLEESQTQCRQLMASNVSCDNIRLQTLLDEAVREKTVLQQTLKSIQTECDMLRSDVAQYESLTKLSLPDESNSSDETDSIVHLGISQKSSRRSSNINLTDIGSKLKDELHRAVLNQKAKRMEIYRLQETLNTKEKQILEMMKKERTYLAQTEALKKDMFKIMDQLKAQRENENRKDNISELISKEEIDRLNKRIVQLQKEKQELETKNKALEEKVEELTEKIEEEKKRVLEGYNNEYMQFHEETIGRMKEDMEQNTEHRLNEYRIKMEQTLKELDEVKRLYVEVSKTKEQLVLELKSEREGKEKLMKEKEEVMTTRDQLTKKVQNSKQENDELNSKLKRLEVELAKNDSTQLKKDSDNLRQEISRMSDLHSDELTKVRTELQTARERLVKLEKDLCTQLENEMVKVRSEKEELRLQFEEKENNLKRIIEAQKRRPILRDIGTETVDSESVSYKDQLVDDHHEELNRLQENHRQVLEAIQKRIVEEEENVKVKHASDLALVEERTKDMAVKFFTEEFRKMETQFQEQLEAANKKPDSTVHEGLQKALLGKTEEVELLKEALSKTYNEYEKKVTALRKQIDEDRDKMSEVMSHWAQEIKIMKSQITLKDTTIEELRSKLKSVRTTAKAYRNQLTGSRDNLKAAQTRMEAILAEKEKEVDIRIEEIERQYETKEKELRNKINRRPRT